LCRVLLSFYDVVPQSANAQWVILPKKPPCVNCHGGFFFRLVTEDGTERSEATQCLWIASALRSSQ
jgi:hypothetical protein